MTYSIDEAINELKIRRESVPLKLSLPDDALIDAYQKAINIKFNEEYRKFMKNASDIVFGTKEILVMTRNRDNPLELESYLRDAREIGLPVDWLPICEDNGDYYCVRPDGKVSFFSHNGSTQEEWNNIAEWIRDVWIGESS